MDLYGKYEKLRGILGELQRVVVAFSGGVDSTLLLKASADALGNKNVVAVTASSELIPSEIIKETQEIARSIGVEHVIAETSQLNNYNFVKNSLNRCYYCKQIIIDELLTIGNKIAIHSIIEGSNIDDLSDSRPGSRACKERDILSPLQMALFTKMEIRELSRTLGLPTADKPSDACLATRIPYGTPIDKVLLSRIGESERRIKELGIGKVRVRSHGSVARIEVEEEDLAATLLMRQAISEALRECGFIHVALDLLGYRTGSMNETEK